MDLISSCIWVCPIGLWWLWPPWPSCVDMFIGILPAKYFLIDFDMFFIFKETMAKDRILKVSKIRNYNIIYYLLQQMLLTIIIM